jgi:hypothetical protein
LRGGITIPDAVWWAVILFVEVIVDGEGGESSITNGNVPLVESDILVDGGKLFVNGDGDDDDKTCSLE